MRNIRVSLFGLPLAAGVLLCSGHSQGAVLSFDDIGFPNGFGAVGTYQGYVFGSTSSIDQLDWIDISEGSIWSVYGPATSGDFAVLNNYGGSGEIEHESGQPFDFTSFYARTWASNVSRSVSVSGYLENTLVNTLPFQLTNSFSLIEPNFVGVDKVVLDFGNYFLIDDVTISPVPVPAAFVLLATAVVGLGGVGVHRRRSRAGMAVVTA